MPTASSLIDVLRREIKTRKITYKALAKQIDMSEASVKRIFSTRNITLQKLDQILEVTQISLDDLTERFYEESLVEQLTYQQEEELIQDQKKFIVAVSVMNYLSFEDIVTIYDISEAQVVCYLTQLDHLGIIELLPNNRYKLLLSRTFQWLSDGPIRQFHITESFGDYLNSSFNAEYHQMQFMPVMLSKQASASFLARLKQLARDISDQHIQDSILPFDQRHTMTFMLAVRPWIPRSFQTMVREKYVKDFQDRKISK
jgi:transcriptional regulator with XRE-family HTH domain